jgi:hypothetical protein
MLGALDAATQFRIHDAQKRGTFTMEPLPGRPSTFIHKVVVEQWRGKRSLVPARICGYVRELSLGQVSTKQDRGRIRREPIHDVVR